MKSKLIEDFYVNHQKLLDYLDSNGEISLRSEADNNFKKVLAIAIGSYFEQIIIDLLIAFTEKASSNNKMLVNFVKNKALNRLYYTYFDWEKRNANKFFSLFGEDFLKEMTKEIQTNQDLEIGMRSFIEIGEIRNNIVHGNFVAYVLEKTAAEIYKLYEKSLIFIEHIDKKIIVNACISA